MVDYRDILVDISPIILSALIYFYFKLVKKNTLLLYIINLCLFYAFHSYIIQKIIDGYGHIFPTVISLLIMILIYIYAILFLKTKKSVIINVFLILIYIAGIILNLYVIFYRLNEGKTLEYICKVVGFDYTKLFKSILENDWFKQISIGIIQTVCGGLILDKIRNRNKEE